MGAEREAGKRVPAGTRIADPILPYTGRGTLGERRHPVAVFAVVGNDFHNEVGGADEPFLGQPRLVRRRHDPMSGSRAERASRISNGASSSLPPPYACASRIVGGGNGIAHPSSHSDWRDSPALASHSG